ncbi:unnamed protein product [Prorocentrum cordatum]|uniref:Protein C10 n=1 Tax=Prorocentrum cordatum TaxID=2364126 RepID=A0ABN9VHW5_9DINO|nr:unnamed protein product [Polarella glacialis]
MQHHGLLKSEGRHDAHLAHSFWLSHPRPCREQFFCPAAGGDWPRGRTAGGRMAGPRDGGGPGRGREPGGPPPTGGRPRRGQGRGPGAAGAAGQDALCLLRALMGAYLEPGFQSEVRDLRDAIVDEARLLCALAPVAGRAQAPVFKRFGLPPGSPGVLVLKMAVKAVSKYSGDELAGDVRESLGLPREEVVQPMTNWLSSPQRSELEDAEEAMVARIARAPVDVRGPLAELLKLPYRASPLEIARRLPHLRQRAEEIAATQLSRGRASVIGHGKALGPELADAPDDQGFPFGWPGSSLDLRAANRPRAKLVDTYEHYLKKMEPMAAAAALAAAAAERVLTALCAEEPRAAWLLAGLCTVPFGELAWAGRLANLVLCCVWVGGGAAGADGGGVVIKAAVRTLDHNGDLHVLRPLQPEFELMTDKHDATWRLVLALSDGVLELGSDLQIQATHFWGGSTGLVPPRFPAALPRQGACPGLAALLLRGAPANQSGGGCFLECLASAEDQEPGSPASRRVATPPGGAGGWRDTCLQGKAGLGARALDVRLRDARGRVVPADVYCTPMRRGASERGFLAAIRARPPEEGAIGAAEDGGAAEPSGSGDGDGAQPPGALIGTSLPFVLREANGCFRQFLWPPNGTFVECISREADRDAFVRWLGCRVQVALSRGAAPGRRQFGPVVLRLRPQWRAPADRCSAVVGVEFPPPPAGAAAAYDVAITVYSLAGADWGLGAAAAGGRALPGASARPGPEGEGDAGGAAAGSTDFNALMSVVASATCSNQFGGGLHVTTCRHRQLPTAKDDAGFWKHAQHCDEHEQHYPTPATWHFDSCPGAAAAATPADLEMPDWMAPPAKRAAAQGSAAQDKRSRKDKGQQQDTMGNSTTKLALHLERKATSANECTVVTPVESFTKAPAEFRCDWADAHVEPRHARELWGLPATAEPRGPGEEWLSLGVGATVIDGTLEGALAADVLRELHALEAAGEVSQSKDPCNIGARSVWLHFETNQERERLPAPLREAARAPMAAAAAALARGSAAHLVVGEQRQK